MLTLLHGDDIVLSRKYFLDLKNASPGAVSFDGEKVNLTDLTQIFEGGGLFADSRTVFIEQLLSKKGRGKKSVELESVVAYLEKNASEHNITLWESKELEKGPLSTFKSAQIKVFKLPQTLFALLDAIKPGNGKKLISLFHQTLENTEAEMIFFMLVRQVRLLLGVTPNQPHPNPLLKGEGILSPSPGGEGRGEGTASLDQIDELKRLTWQRGKLEQQAKAFGHERLIKLHHDLFQIEKAQKTGTLTSPLVSTIDFLLVDI